MTFQVQIKKPPAYPGSDIWIDLQVERIDWDVNNDVSVVATTKDENKAIDVTAASVQMLITGVLAAEPPLPSMVMWQIIKYAREWKFAGIDQSDITTNAKVKWRNHEEYMMIHRLTFIEMAETDAGSLEYLLTLAIRIEPPTP